MATAEEEVAGEAVVVEEVVVGVGEEEEEVALGEEVDGTKEDTVDMAEREDGTGINWYELCRGTRHFIPTAGENLSDFMVGKTVFSILLFPIFYRF